MAVTAQPAVEGLGRVLALYRRLLRLHRGTLPPAVRGLGDAYVRSEFSRHLRGATTPAQWRMFVGEWERYAGMLGAVADGGAAGAAQPGAASADALVSGIDRAGDLDDATLRAMSPDQLARLEVLRAEAAALGRAALPASHAAAGGEPGGGGSAG